MVESGVTYNLHGLTVRSEHGLGAEPGHGKLDLAICNGEERRIAERPPANTVARVRFGTKWTWVCAGEARIKVGFSGTCEFVHEVGAGRLLVAKDPAADARRVPRLIESSVLAVLLAFAGTPTLHASAVDIDGRAWALLGASGAGKTTLAAWLCRYAGASLVTDDALRFDTDRDRPWCYRGTTTLRLREGACALHASFPNGQIKPEVDGRLLVRPPVSAGHLPVQALLFPRPSRSLRRVRVEALTKRETLLEVLAYARAVGWTITEPLRLHFELAEYLSLRVPGFRLHVPWGPPFEASTALQLREGIASALAAARRRTLGPL